MRRGTTPTHTFSVDVDLTDADVYVTYSQDGEVVLEKTGEDLTVTEDEISVTLTQDDTLRLDASAGAVVGIQIRYVTEDGVSDASNIMVEEVGGLLKEGAITDV